VGAGGGEGVEVVWGGESSGNSGVGGSSGLGCHTGTMPSSLAQRVCLRLLCQSLLLSTLNSLAEGGGR
jgi:hypothetical protein